MACDGNLFQKQGTSARGGGSQNVAVMKIIENNNETGIGNTSTLTKNSMMVGTFVLTNIGDKQIELDES